MDIVVGCFLRYMHGLCVLTTLTDRVYPHSMFLIQAGRVAMEMLIMVGYVV